MATERTLSIIKPDAVAKNAIGEIIARFEKAGLKVVAAKMMHLSEEKAGGFYAEHKERPFFKDLVGFMTSGPVVVQVLEGEGAIAKNRELLGATNPKEAAPGTIRLTLRKQSTPTLSMALILRKALSAKLFTNGNDEICALNKRRRFNLRCRPFRGGFALFLNADRHDHHRSSTYACSQHDS